MSVPALRFKDEAGEDFPKWSQKILGEIATFSKGKGISKADIDENGITYCIRYGELYTEYGETIRNVKSKTNVDVKNLVLSDVNDVIIPASGETQIDIATASCVQVSGVALGGDLNIIKSQENGVFLTYYLNSQKKLDIAKLAQGNSVVHLYSSQLKLLDVNLPEKSEQTKIANFLTAVDEKISLLTQKHDLLTQYKKGVMQQIFSQELRFKDDDGSDFPEWEERGLKDVAQINPKTGPLPDKFVYIDLESVEKGVLLKETIIEKNGSPSRAQRLLKKDDVLFQMVRPYQGNNLFFNKEGIYVASTGYAQIRPSENALFLYHFLHLEDFIAEVMNRCTGTSYPAINSSDLATITIHMPVEIEQTKIANFLTAIDDKITAIQTQLKAVKQYKQGLLQQMFV